MGNSAKIVTVMSQAILHRNQKCSGRYVFYTLQVSFKSDQNSKFKVNRWDFSFSNLDYDNGDGDGDNDNDNDDVDDDDDDVDLMQILMIVAGYKGGGGI